MNVPMIWLISSDSDTRRLIRLNLNKRGFDVLEISPQGELVPSDAKPQLIILDMGSLDESGWEAARALRQTPEAQGTPMILLLPAAPAAKRLAPLRPVRWLEKPLDIDTLLAQVWESLA